MEPTVAFPPLMLSTLQVTPRFFGSSVTVAVYCCVCVDEAIAAILGLTLTVMLGDPVPPPVLPPPVPPPLPPPLLPPTVPVAPPPHPAIDSAARTTNTPQQLRTKKCRALPMKPPETCIQISTK